MINPEKYEIVPIYISKEGVMYTGDDLLDLYQYKDMEVLLKRSYNSFSTFFIKILSIPILDAKISGPT